MTFLDEAMRMAIRRDIPTDERFLTALGERTDRGITSIFDAKAAHRRRIARELREFLAAYPMEVDE